MEKNYKFILKKLVCNKVRNIYIKINSKSKKQYLKYKGKMINIKKYKKIKTDLKNKNNKIYRKKKGGYDKESQLEKLHNFINKIKDLDIKDIVEIQDAFLDIYTNIKNRHLNLEASINEHLNFLTTLLIYFEDNFSNLRNIEYKILLEKIRQLLQTIEESAITGIYSYDSVPSGNPYTINDSRNFHIIINVIEKFMYKHKKIAWTSFLQKYKFLKKENITISNTQVSTFITYMISHKGLNAFNSKHSKHSKNSKHSKHSKHSRFKPY